MLGLRAHDLITDQDPDVAEAIKKLPEEEYQLRLERLRRALDLSMKHRILPRNQWTTPEQVRIRVTSDEMYCLKHCRILTT